MDLFILIGQIAAAVTLCAAIGYVSRLLWHYRQERMQEREQELERKRKQQERLAEQSVKKRTFEQSLTLLQAAAERAAAEQAASARAAAERIAKERAAADKAIAEWISAEEDEQRHTAALLSAAAQTEAEKAESKKIVAERAIAEWVAAMQAEVETSGLSRRPPPVKKKRNAKKIDAIKEQVLLMLQQLESEMNELEFIINEIQTKVDFLPLQVQDTIDKWKRGEVYRRVSFQELKLKFRYQAFSIQDGWDAYYMYCDWIDQQRQKLLVFARVLGTEAAAGESIRATLERAEKAEWAKHLDLDMEVVFSLKQMKDILQRLDVMERRLTGLETACKKRSEQVIQPSWDPKGT